MDKRVLPVVASLLITAMLFASLTPALADWQGPTGILAKVEPTLKVVTIPEDDEVRKTGVIVFGLEPKAGWNKPYENGTDKLAQYKIMVTFNGQPWPFDVSCQFIKKEKMRPLQKPQGPWENLKTSLTDESRSFDCKLREGKPGVGVLDVYYVGTQEKQFIADYVMVVQVWTTIGAETIYGMEIQDVCVLGWAISNNWLRFTKPDGSEHDTWDDALGPFASCEEAALWQRDNLGLGFSYD